MELRLGREAARRHPVMAGGVMAGGPYGLVSGTSDDYPFASSSCGGCQKMKARRTST